MTAQSLIFVSPANRGSSVVETDLFIRDGCMPTGQYSERETPAPIATALTLERLTLQPRCCSALRGKKLARQQTICTSGTTRAQGHGCLVMNLFCVTFLSAQERDELLIQVKRLEDDLAGFEVRKGRFEVRESTCSFSWARNRNGQYI